MFSKLKNLNKVIILLTITDIFTWGPYLIISALTGVYLSTKLGENIVEFIGIGTSIYFLTRAILQIPIGLFNDNNHHDKDEILMLTIGVLLMGSTFLFYPLIESPYHYYILQFIFGLGASLNVTNWRKLFALNIKKGQEGLSYGVYDTAISLSTALLSTLVGIIANLGNVYFDIAMICSSVLIMSSGIYVLMIGNTNNRKSKNIS